MTDTHRMPRGGHTGLMMVTTCHCPACGREMVKQTAEGRACFCMWCGADFRMPYRKPTILDVEGVSAG